jgi:hypothetical protein
MKACKFKVSLLCRIIDKFTRNANRNRTIGDPNNQRSDKWSFVAIHSVLRVSKFMARETALHIASTITHCT